MKKKLISTFFALAFFLAIYSQEITLKTIPFYIDSKIVGHICDSLETKGVENFYIFLTQYETNPTTYLIWQEEGINFVIRIEDTVLYSTNIRDINFLKANYRKLAILESENQLVFSSPLNPNLECSCFIYRSKTIRYLIENNAHCSGYKFEKCKNMQRESFINSIKQNIELINSSSWRVFVKYNRYAEN
jgi:hypothetical protein